jgi:hypothetical protein
MMSKCKILRVAALLTAGFAAGTATPYAYGQQSWWRDVRNECPLAFQQPTRNTVEACGVDVFTAEPIHPLIQGLGPGIAATGFGLSFVKTFNQFPFSQSDRFQNRASFSGTYSPNGFWFAEGKFDITHPAIAPKDYSESSQSDRLEAILFARTDHRSKLDFYGLGPQSSLADFVRYREDMSEIGLKVSNPVSRWFEFGGEINGQWLSNGPPESTSIRPIENVFTNQQVPGIAIATAIIHYQSSLRRPFKSQCIPRPGKPCAKLADWISGRYFDYSIQYEYYQDIRLGQYSFYRFTVDTAQPLTLRSLNARPKSQRTRFSNWFCSDNQQGGCEFGQFVARERFVASYTGNGSSVPLSLQEELGGTDISGQDTLRGYRDLRFRGPNLLLLQAEYAHPIWSPINILLFYDAGEVANHAGDVSAANLRQDWGTGLQVAIQKGGLMNVVFRFTVGFGSGEGVQYKPRVAPNLAP